MALSGSMPRPCFESSRQRICSDSPPEPAQRFCDMEECLNNCRENSFAFVGLSLVPDTLAKLVGRCSNPCLASKPELDRRMLCQDVTVWYQSTNCVAPTGKRFLTLTSKVTASESELLNLKKLLFCHWWRQGNASYPAEISQVFKLHNQKQPSEDRQLSAAPPICPI